YLAAPNAVDAMRAVHAIQQAEGADVELLEPDALTDRLSGLSTDGVARGSLGRSGEGWFDGDGLTRAFRRAAIARGVTYHAAEATAIRRADGRILADPPA